MRLASLYSVIAKAFIFVTLSFSSPLLAQTDWWEQSFHHEARFVRNNQLNGGFDDIQFTEWKQQFELIEVNDTLLIPSIQSVYKGKGDYISLLIDSTLSIPDLSFYLNKTLWESTVDIHGDTLHMELPPLQKDQLLECRLNGRSIALLKILVFNPIIEHLVVVGLEDLPNLERFQEELDEVYRQAGLKIFISSSTSYSDSVLKSDHVFSNPDQNHLIYTSEMRQLRDRFFASHPSASREAYYLFVVNSFNDKEIQAYGAYNKAMIFATAESLKESPLLVVKELARSIGMLSDSWLESGPAKGSTNNLMDEPSGKHLHAIQWLELRHSSRSFSFYDADEDLITNNGLIAYFFWEEDDNGFVKIQQGSFLKSIRRPFRKNYLSYHLNIQDALFYNVIDQYGIKINGWHLILWGATLLLTIIFRLRMLRKWKEAAPSTIKRKVLTTLFFSSIAVVFVASYHFINFEMGKFEVHSGEIEELKGLSVDKVINSTLYNTELKYRNESALGSEVLRKQNDKWMMSRCKPVLYFDAQIDSVGNMTRVKFKRDSDSLILRSKKINQIALTHYIVISYIYEDKTKELIYDYNGKELSSKFSEPDPAKRILLFVNGYRPTSLGHNFEENFDDVLNKGFEYPQTTNMIYSFDRYDYWQPWSAIDDLFKDRINPQETFYADGHFSVSTSNYNSLFNFSKVAASYPKRCKNSKKHICNELKINTISIFGRERSPTTSLLPRKPNKSGFNERKENGRIAGINLIALLNELPGTSKNDTIYIVAHSMGYAYALGIVNQIKPEINLGGFYILAPENAKSGTVNRSDWNEVWQYGSDWRKSTAACLQDGIAPQTAVSGLTSKQRCYFPNNGWYTKQGFFNSHFVGYYTWIFDIPEGKKGHIPQR